MLYFAVAALVVIIDQSSKRLIWEIYQYTGGTNVLGEFLRFRLSKNSGAVLGILSGSRVILVIITIISIGALILFAHRMRHAPASRRICLGLVLGGAFGNLIDRLATGEVLDFIDMGFGAYRWPTYNVADIAVTIGAILLIIGFIRHPHDGDEEIQITEEVS